MKHYKPDLSDVVIHPLYKTKQFDYILRNLFTLLYPEATAPEIKKFIGAMGTFLNGNLDAYKAYQQCCATLLLSRILSAETATLFVGLDILEINSPGYRGFTAIAESLVNMLEDASKENIEYWNDWFEERDAAFEQWVFQEFIRLIRNND